VLERRRIHIPPAGVERLARRVTLHDGQQLPERRREREPDGEGKRDAHGDADGDGEPDGVGHSDAGFNERRCRPHHRRLPDLPGR
jgi:hypothetical protein